ncbi:MAG: hypothetical protein EXX96DRAFT_538488 [Benjaminiella poitrasii]|nr:MAG: hypothetical protein EXX96DRAFT_538488 [Benjaminiella poitrasii]
MKRKNSGDIAKTVLRIVSELSMANQTTTSKIKSNYYCNNLKYDLLKLGEEMQVALDKLDRRKVKKSKIVGILINGYYYAATKMDLVYDRLYRIIEISIFNFT